MSIINDALKKVQQGLNDNANNASAKPSTPAEAPSAYIYATTPPVENIPASKAPIKENVTTQTTAKSIAAFILAVMITLGSAWYIWQQVQNNVPKVQVFAQKSFSQLIHKIQPVKKPASLGSLAKLTINPSTSSNTVKPDPVTLDIHGIMSNSTGNVVLINDQVYQEGDVVDGAKIIKINLDSIKVINNGAEQTIFVKN